MVCNRSYARPQVPCLPTSSKDAHAERLFGLETGELEKQ
jgi:hypothetical protein